MKSFALTICAMPGATPGGSAGTGVSGGGCDVITVGGGGGVGDPRPKKGRDNMNQLFFWQIMSDLKESTG